MSSEAPCDICGGVLDITATIIGCRNCGTVWGRCNKDDTSFGSAISAARKAKNWSLKDLAAKVLREDDEGPISPQYLNDIEHDRRSPSSDWLVKQFAKALDLDADWLYYLAGRFPEDVRNKKLTPDDVRTAMVAFRGGPPKGRR